MSVDFELHAESRDDLGKGASRRLRRQGRVPAIMYGGNKEPHNLSIEHRELLKQLEQEAFYSHILNVRIADREERVVLRDLQRHPYKPTILHVDLLRVSADAALRMNVPLHFINEDKAYGVREEGGVIGHLMNEVEISCLPKDLPEYIEVDVSDLRLGDSIVLSQIKLPEGVEIIQLMHGEEQDQPVVNIHHLRVIDEEDEEGEEGEEGAEDVAGEEDEV